MTAPGEAAWATRRTPALASYGARAALVADQVLGTPLMPWQRQVADVALELDASVPGQWRYPTVVVSVPRQAGKTALMRAIAVDRLLSYRSHLIQMTAQTGKDARKRWDQIVTALDVDTHPKMFKKLASRGAESLTYMRSGSSIAPFAPTPTAVHGDSLHLVMVDEAWAFDEPSGIALTAAINPTFATVLDNQLWIVSTKGTAKSAYLNALIERGRAAVGDPSADLAYFEWSADPDQAEADPYGRETLAFHPAIGHTQTYEKILSLGKDEPLATWRRSYLNLTDPGGLHSAIDLAIWDGLATHVEIPTSLDQVTIAFDVAEDSSAATIYAAWVDEDDTPTAAMLATQPGQTWLAPAIRNLHKAGYTDLVADPTGPTRTVLADLTDDGIPVTELTSREYATACQWVIDKATSGDFAHDGAPQTRTALEGAVVTPISGTKAFNTTKSPVPIDALRALAIATHRAATRPIGLQLY